MDTQVVGLLGKNKLISELLLAGFEVAIPERDRGIDLIAYLDTNKFISIPIQMKASTRESFNLYKKYSKFPDMVLTYLWYIDDFSKTTIYALTYSEALGICEKMEWTKTQSWKKGGYSTSKPSSKLKRLLEPYKMNSKKWKGKLKHDHEIQ